jgi:hypothetical protein
MLSSTPHHALVAKESLDASPHRRYVLSHTANFIEIFRSSGERLSKQFMGSAA